MTKLEQLERDLEKILKTAKNPVLCWSGGKDSTFLLRLIKKLDYNVPVLMFSHFWNKRQTEFIKKFLQKHEITTFFYRPVDGKYISPHLVVNYFIGDKKMPVVFDHKDDPSKCGIDIGKRAFVGPHAMYIWDITILGSKKKDRHALVEQLDFSGFCTSTEIKTPLWNWTDEEVLETMRDLDYEINDVDTGEFIACMACYTTEDVFCPKRGEVIKGVYA